jgi:hypothetical protein
MYVFESLLFRDDNFIIFYFHVFNIKSWENSFEI